MVDVIGVCAFAGILLWVLVLRRYLPKRRPQGVPAELTTALQQQSGMQTWLALTDEERLGLAEFVRLAWSRRERQRRAEIVAARCGDGSDAIEAWMLNNRALVRSRTQHTPYG